MTRSIRYVETSAAQTVRGALDVAIRLRFPVLAIGNVGLGKSEALRRIRSEGKASYWEVAQHTKNIKSMFLMILGAYDLRPYKHFTFELGDQVLRQLNGSDEPLLVDEYQNLAPTVLRELLFIQERCGFPLLLAGNRERIASTRRDTGAMEQIESRIGARFHIGLPTRQDCANIAVEYNVEGRDAYDALTNYGQNTSLRALCRLLDMCAAATDGVGSIGLHRIETALRGLNPGSRDALKILTRDYEPGRRGNQHGIR